MNKIATTLTALAAALLFGCTVNPCESALFNGLSLEQQTNCTECNNYQSCDAGETGEDEEPDPDYVTCPVDDMRYCWRGELLPSTVATLNVPGGVTTLPSIGCGALTSPFLGSFACSRDWSGNPAVPLASECVVCEFQDGEFSVPFESPPFDMWPVCDAGNPYSPAGMGAWDDEGNHYPSCTPGGTTPFAAHDWTCPEGIVQIFDSSDAWTHSPAHNWTCRCDGNDNDCQPGAVCEAAWMPDALGSGKYTLCTWDDGSGTANGPAPEGPAVYGLAQWGDGIDVSRSSTGNVVTIDITSSMLWAAVQGGLFNDDQRFDVGLDTITITHCGAASLCGYLGLVDGVEFDLETAIGFVDALLDGSPATLPVTFPGSGPNPTTLVIVAQVD